MTIAEQLHAKQAEMRMRMFAGIGGSFEKAEPVYDENLFEKAECYMDDFLIEKAKRQVGETKEINGKTYVWNEYQPGKYDWKVANKKKGTGEGDGKSQSQPKSLADHAKGTSTETLKKVAGSNAPKQLVDAAKKELESRGEGENGNGENGSDRAEKQPQQSNRKVTKVGEKSALYENNGHKYITMDHGYGENKKSDFIKDVKAYLKSQGETFDPSKVTVKKEIGYDHYKHPVYTYTMSGNREEEEKMHSDHLSAKRKAMDEKVAAWKKNNETAEDILGARAYDIITKHETPEENKERMDAADDIEYEKVKAKIAKRISSEVDLKGNGGSQGSGSGKAQPTDKKEDKKDEQTPIQKRRAEIKKIMQDDDFSGEDEHEMSEIANNIQTYERIYGTSLSKREIHEMSANPGYYFKTDMIGEDGTPDRNNPDVKRYWKLDKKYDGEERSSMSDAEIKEMTDLRKKLELQHNVFTNKKRVDMMRKSPLLAKLLG